MGNDIRFCWLKGRAAAPETAKRHWEFWEALRFFLSELQNLLTSLSHCGVTSRSHRNLGGAVWMGVSPVFLPGLGVRRLMP